METHPNDTHTCTHTHIYKSKQVKRYHNKSPRPRGGKKGWASILTLTIRTTSTEELSAISYTDFVLNIIGTTGKGYSISSHNSHVSLLIPNNTVITLNT